MKIIEWICDSCKGTRCDSRDDCQCYQKSEDSWECENLADCETYCPYCVDNEGLDK